MKSERITQEELGNELYEHLSRKEAQLKAILDEMYAREDGEQLHVIDNQAHSFLPSPKGSLLKLDRYYPDLKIAFEFRGPQHEFYTPFMHKTQPDFAYMKACDYLKEYYCSENRIALIVFTDDEELSKLMEWRQSGWV